MGLGKWDNAEADYKQATKLKPINTLDLLLFTRTIRDEFKNPKIAALYYQRVIETDKSGEDAEYAKKSLLNYKQKPLHHHQALARKNLSVKALKPAKQKILTKPLNYSKKRRKWVTLTLCSVLEQCTNKAKTTKKPPIGLVKRQKRVM
jgi:hypothetical protein